jgi:hypothetical protein
MIGNASLQAHVQVPKPTLGGVFGPIASVNDLMPPIDFLDGRVEAKVRDGRTRRFRGLDIHGGAAAVPWTLSLRDRQGIH